MSFFKELKRRNVFKVGVAYLVACWLGLQIIDLVLENINAPEWIMQVFMLALAVGFPIAIIIAWAFEVTPEGVKLQKNVDRSRSINRQTGQQLNRGIIVILSVAIVFLLTDRFRNDLFGEPEAPEVNTDISSGAVDDEADADATLSIAVLPFRDMSAAQDQAYFGEGIAEELLNALVKVEGLDVASRTSAFSLAGEKLDIPTIAARLGVNHILEGSIRTSGQQVRVTAQLIEVSKDVHLWSETYDGSLDDIFKIQDEITEKITDALKLQLGSSKQLPSAELMTDNAEAYQLYLQGRHLWRQRNAASLKEAVRLFKEAVALDPGFDRAWSNLAVAYLNLADYDRTIDAEEGFELGLDAAEKALAINPNSTEALIIRANYEEYHCNIAEAGRLYEAAIKLDPNDPTAHHWYAIFLTTSGRLDQALEHIKIARSIDPLISAVIAIEAEININLGNYEHAQELQHEAALLGLFGGSLYQVGMNYLYEGEFEKGKVLIEKGWTGEDPAQIVTRQLFLAAFENPANSSAFEKHIGKAVDSEIYRTIEVIEYLALLGSPYVFEYESDLECAVADQSFWSERFREQRKAPEFFELMERAGMVEYWREFGWPDDCASLDQTLAECDP